MERETRDKIVDSIQHEQTFPKQDLGAQEDELFYRLGELVESGMLTADEAQDCFNDWMRVFHYEGRE